MRSFCFFLSLFLVLNQPVHGANWQNQICARFLSFLGQQPSDLEIFISRNQQPFKIRIPHNKTFLEKTVLVKRHEIYFNVQGFDFYVRVKDEAEAQHIMLGFYNAALWAKKKINKKLPLFFQFYKPPVRNKEWRRYELLGRHVYLKGYIDLPEISRTEGALILKFSGVQEGTDMSSPFVAILLERMKLSNNNSPTNM